MFEELEEKIKMLGKISNIHLVVEVPEEIEKLYYSYDNGDETESIKPLNITSTIKDYLHKETEQLKDNELYTAIFESDDKDKVYSTLIIWKNKVASEIKMMIYRKIKEISEPDAKLIIAKIRIILK